MVLTAPPVTPPAQISGSSILDGPSSAPPGAVVVGLSDNVSTLTAANPAGTTFWFVQGTHTFTYSVVPKDGNTYTGAPGAVVDGGGTQNIAFWEDFYGAKAVNVTLSYLTIQNFTSSGTNQGSIYAGRGWRVTHCTLRNHGYVALFAGPDNVIDYNWFDSNGQLAVGTYRFDNNNYNVIIDHNEITRNNTRDLGGGVAGGVKWWTMQHGQFTNNWVHHNTGPGVWSDGNNIELLFEGNYINDNTSEGVFYEISFNFMIRYNTFIRNALIKGAQLDGNFPIAAVYISESGGVADPGYAYSLSEIHDNYFEDNWDGVALWESGNRYAGTDGPGYAPVYGPDPIHWHTQNVWVHDNQFHLDKAVIGQVGNPNCGRNGLFSDWVPVPGGHASAPNTTSNQYQVAVTFNQNNIFSNNTYRGDWAFVGYDDTLLYDRAVWLSPRPDPPSAFVYYAPAPYGFHQDVTSMFDVTDGLVTSVDVSGAKVDAVAIYACTDGNSRVSATRRTRAGVTV